MRKVDFLATDIDVSAPFLDLAQPGPHARSPAVKTSVVEKNRNRVYINRMSCVVGFGAYRWELIDHEVPVRLIGPDGTQFRQLSRALSGIWDDENPKEAKRWIGKFVWSLNAAHERMPDVADQYEAGLDQAREAQDAFVVSLNIHTRDSRPYDGSMWLKPKKAIWSKVSDALIAMGKVTERLSDELYGGEDPSKVNLALSRTLGKPRSTAKVGKSMRSDVDRRLRLGTNPALAPRYDDPRLFDRWTEGLTATRAPAVFERVADLGRFAGARAFQALSLTLFDVFCSGEDNCIRAPNKGSKFERTMEFELPDSRWAKLLGWVGGERARLTGLSLENIRRMASIPTEAARLATMPLFTEDGVNPIGYPRLYRVMRKAAERADLYITSDEYRLTGLKRFPGFHYLRHEFVHRWLDAAEELDEKGRAAKRRALITYMRWSAGDEMLAWYSAHHMIKVARVAVRAHNAAVDAALEGNVVQPVGLIRADDAHIASALLAGLV